MKVSSAEPEALSRSLKCVQRTVRSGAADGPPDIKKNLPEPDGTESGWRCVQRTVRGLSADSPVSWIFVTADGPPVYCGRSAVPFSAGPGQLGQTNWWRRSIAWPRLQASFRIVLKPYILHCAMTSKD